MIKYTNYIYEGHEKQQTSLRLTSDFEKKAYDMSDTVKEFVDSLKPSEKGDVNYHWINALGAGETYGANSRGDYFPRQELIDHHHTFVDNPARVYVQHANKDPEIRLGDVLFSYFNPDTDRVEVVQSIEKSRLDKHAPDWVRSQLHVGQPYNTSMGCMRAGTKIRTKYGIKNIEDITEDDLVLTHTGQYKKVTGLFSKQFDEGIFSLKIRSRGGKPFFVTYEHPFYCIKKNQLVTNNHIDIKYKSSEVQPDWVKTQDLEIGDYVGYGFTDITATVTDDITKDFARLLGYYYSDGYLYTKKRLDNPSLHFYFALHETRYMEEIKQIIINVTGNEPIIKSDSKRGYYIITVHNKPFIDKYKRFFTKDKQLPQEILSWPKELQLELLGAFINGDGFIYNRNTYFEVKSYELADQLCQLACRNRLVWTIQKIVHKANENSVCKTGTVSECYQVKFSKSAGGVLKTVTDKASSDIVIRDEQFYHGTALFSKIYDIEFDADWSGMIYNFEVADDESYIADNIVVHNCKVAYDECSKCGQKNKTVGEYCDHLKYAMNQWQDGVHIHAINVDPNFFDNSIVRKGADKIARQLKKVASLEIVSPSLTILEDRELVIPRKTYVFFESNELPYINETNHDLVTQRIETLPKDKLQALTQYKLHDVLGVCKEASFELLPSEYQYLVLNSMGAADLADEYHDTQTRFRISNDSDNRKIKLGHDDAIVDTIFDDLPFKSLSKPFLLFNALTFDTAEPTKYNVLETPLLNTIAKSYTQYLSQEKTASDLWSSLLAIFFLTDNIPARLKSEKLNNDIIVDNMSAIKKRVAEIPVVRGKYNPVFKTDFMKTSMSSGVKSGLVDLGIPIAAGVAGAGYLVGSAKQDEDAQEEPGVIAGFARKHPIITGVGIATATKAGINKIKKIGFKKKASDITLCDSYKQHLATQTIDDFFKMIQKIPDDLVSKICF